MIHDYERLDSIELLSRTGRQLYVIQNPKWFCFGIDAVLLANFARVKRGAQVLDLCTGSGIIPTILAAKTNASHFDAVELITDVAKMAERTVEYNGQTDIISVINADLRSYTAKKHYDCVTCNPPYKEYSGGAASANEYLAAARTEINCTLSDVCDCASRCLKYGGGFYMVHRPERIADIIEFMRKAFLEPKRLRFVYPYADKAPCLVLIEGRKNGMPKLIIEPPLIIYNNNGSYTDEIHSIYGRNTENV